RRARPAARPLGPPPTPGANTGRVRTAATTATAAPTVQPVHSPKPAPTLVAPGGRSKVLRWKGSRPAPGRVGPRGAGQRRRVRSGEILRRADRRGAAEQADQNPYGGRSCDRGPCR